MKRCLRCGIPRADESFYSNSHHPDDVCKPCIHRPRSVSVKALKIVRKECRKSRPERAQAAVRHVVKHSQSSGESFVYLVRANNDWKIGVSTDVYKRVRQLSTGSAAPIQLIAVVPGDRQLEQKLHAKFKKLRTRGEWFRNIENTLVNGFSELPGVMIFLPNYVSQELPMSGVTG